MLTPKKIAKRLTLHKDNKQYRPWIKMGAEEMTKEFVKELEKIRQLVLSIDLETPTTGVNDASNHVHELKKKLEDEV